MKRLLFVLLMACVTLGGLFANPATLALFRYDEAKMNPGTVYAYEYQDLKGQKQGDYYYYIRNDGTLQSLLTSVSGVSILSTMHIDKNYFVFKNHGFDNKFAYMRIPGMQSSGGAMYDFTKKNFTIKFNSVQKTEVDKTTVFTVNIQFLPAYDLSFLLYDFALAMRHYVGRRSGSFEIGLMAAGNFANGTVNFEREEIVNGVMCEKWLIQGKGVLAMLFGVKQEIWFAKNDPYYRMVQYKNYMKLFSQHLILAAVETKTEAEWQDFVAEQTEAIRIKMGYPKE